MPDPNLSILLIDDAASSAESIIGELHLAGYREVRHCRGEQALDTLDHAPASLLLIHTDNALELAGAVRRLDERDDRYSYIIVIGEQNAQTLLDEAGDHGVDDLIAPRQLHELLAQRVYTGGRLCNMIGRLQQECRLMRQNIAGLEQRNQIDSLTGLGNDRYLRQKLVDSLRQVQSRGGALCLLLIGLPQSRQLRREHGEDYLDEVLQGVARRLQHMVRPLDVLARLDDQHFVLLTLPADLKECAPSSFKRLHDGLNVKGFMTSTGHLDLRAGISLVGLDGACLPIEPHVLLDEARALLEESYASGSVTAKRLLARP